MSARPTKRNPASGAYARALLAVGIERNEDEAYGDELRFLAERALAGGEARVFYESPKVPRAEKKQALDRALRGKVSDPVLNLLLILLDRGRPMLLGEIATVYRELLDAARGRVHVRVRSAAEISQDSLGQLVGLLGKTLKREILAESATDARLLGGMTVQIGDTMIDGSVRARLDVIRDALVAQRLGKELIQ